MGFLIVGVILMIVGVVLFFIQKNQKNKAFCLRSARPVTTTELKDMSKAIAQEIGGGSWRDYVKLSGVIQCDRPITSELKQEPCVYYKMEVRREYEEKVTKQDSEGKSYQDTQRGSEVISSNQQSIPFTIQDDRGAIEVNPDGANIETVKILDEFRPEQAVGGLLSFGGFSLAVNSSFGNRRTLGYRYSESILPLYRKVLVVGTVSDSGGLVIQKPPESEQQFIISLRTDEELTKAADRNAKGAFYGMVGCLAVGAVLVLVGLVAR
ncbi:E3 ubiquitin ligase [Oscillatoria sp. FACHB-1407]|uniref:E3 ubiquitin ligase family protein n=1 Tax=Oscillatoria sp. FACHB-1407 TaxID=2692847 RepID=UPI001683FFF4|nr:E3 ubiquitin ligase family protein [Oscillatoria sp. FACHB-1407]MBD2464979.1 E3 ubiquitin ligase [Oscillatoria sp. FACHB-1407]